MKILLLGGTKDARQLASSLIDLGFDVIYSVQGLVRKPDLACEIISGGFKHLGGLASYCQSNDIDLIMDATHPFAARMTEQAFDVGQVLNLPVLHFVRPAWRPEHQDDWVSVADFEAALAQLDARQSIFLSVGQLPQDVLKAIEAKADKQFLLRTAVQPKDALPPNVRWKKAIGPFALEDEFALLKCYDIDTLLTKNSGGESTYPKLVAAKQLGIKVVMFERPALPEPLKKLDSLETCIEKIKQHSKQERPT